VLATPRNASINKGSKIIRRIGFAPYTAILELNLRNMLRTRDGF
jgi:hypothetical protein